MISNDHHCFCAVVFMIYIYESEPAKVCSEKKSSMFSKAFMFYFVSKDLFYYFDFIALIFLFEKLKDKNKILRRYILYKWRNIFQIFFSNQNLLLKKGLRAKALAWGHLKKWCYDPNTSKLLLIAIYRKDSLCHFVSCGD